VLTLLPGSDPLATLLAAGQTPPPEIVAAASTSRPMRSQAAVVCILATVVALTAVILLADHTLLLSKLGLGKSPHVLVDRAADIVRTLGGEWNGAVRVGTFIVDVREGGPAQVYFEERSQSGPSKPTRLLGDPNPLGAGVTSAVQNVVRLDRAGRLLLYMEDGDIPAQGSAAKEPDWRVPFEMAGLSLEAFSPATPSRTPPGFADHRREWKGRGGAGHQEEVRVAGASLNGRVIYFNVVEDWKGNRAALSTRLQKASSVGTVLFLVTLLGSLPLAWKNVRAGRGDRRGAWRLAMFMLALDLLWWLCRCRHVWQFTAESNLLLEGLRACGFTAVMVWVYYIALEPLVRRFRPRSMVSWSRVLAGRLHDPLVGRDMLVGIAAGVGVVLLQQVVTWAPKWMSGAPVVPLLPDSFDELGVILGFRYAVGTFARTLMVAVAYGMTWAMVLLLLWKALRRRGPTVVAFWVAVTLEHGLTTGSASLARWLVSAAIAATLAALFTLNGLLAASVSMFVMRLLLSSPLTSDPQMWWAGPSALVITVIVLLLGFAYHAALRGQARHYSTA